MPPSTKEEKNINIKLVNCVQKRKCLYDSTRSSKKDIKKNWKKIARELRPDIKLVLRNISDKTRGLFKGKACKTRWYSLRAAYVRYIKQKKDNPLDNNYYVHYIVKHLKFLDPFMKHNSDLNSDERDANFEDGEDSDSEDEEDFDSEDGDDANSDQGELKNGEEDSDDEKSNDVGPAMGIGDHNNDENYDRKDGDFHIDPNFETSDENASIGPDSYMKSSPEVNEKIDIVQEPIPDLRETHSNHAISPLLFKEYFTQPQVFNHNSQEPDEEIQCLHPSTSKHSIKRENNGNKSFISKRMKPNPVHEEHKQLKEVDEKNSRKLFFL